MTGATWRVDEAAQHDFAVLSGDHNPIHVDPIAARRTPFGRLTVHGVHLLLDGLERLLERTDGSPTRVRCTFRHPVAVGDTVTTTVPDQPGTEVTVVVAIDVWVAAEIAVTLGPPAHPWPLPPELAPTGPLHSPPESHTIGELAGRDGALALALDADRATARFPTLAGRLGTGTVAELLALTRLVGMHVPGRWSLLSALDVTIGTDRPGAPTDLRYRVARTDERFSLVLIDVTGPTLDGRVTAFVRPAPVRPDPGGARPDGGEFAGQCWLVVGGSRGLGATTVLLLAAGGADVRFTYLVGAEDATEVATRAAGSSAHRFDVADPDPALDALMADGWQPTHLAWFASPPIFEGVAGAYSDRLRERFVSVYVDAFSCVVERLLPSLRGVLWPSSEAVAHDVAGLAEYADAKRAGEALCARIAAEHPSVAVHAPRLPRLRTDQTTSFVPVEFGDAGDELLAAVRAVADGHS